MRAAQLPESLSIGRHGASHFVVTATKASESFRRFQSRCAAAHRTPAAAVSSPPLSHASPALAFHLAHLTAGEWSMLLRACRAHTDPSTAVNYSSPGDVSSVASVPTTATSGPAEAVSNMAFLHMVERRPGDFVPNNMIYHALQQYTSADGDATVEARNAAFNAFVTTLQTASRAEQDESAYTQPAHDAEAKRARDPLAQDAEARAHSTANAHIRPPCCAATVTTASSCAPSETFYFHPYPVKVDASIPYRSRHFCVLVNLKPIVPRHLMVVPLRCVGTLHGLTEEEVEDWGTIMALTIRALDVAARLDQSQPLAASLAAPPSEGNYSIAVQQGAAAGQTVAHLHTHVIPFDPRGKLAGEPESDEQEQQRRAPRTPAMMAEETRFFATIFQHLTA